MLSNSSRGVYLEHLITRESLRFKRSKEKISPSGAATLRMSDLFEDHRSSRVSFLRKPDFQRATWAWSPEDCVSLLESIVNDHVIPSIIMWTSPENGLDYVLDGGHRVSVVLAWLNDDWGDKLRLEDYRDEEQALSIKKVAREVRDLVKLRVGSISEYQLADNEFNNILKTKDAPRDKLDQKTFNRGLFYQRLCKGDIGFHILWVNGDYEKAETSFLKINKSGNKLSEWETTIIENRSSSLIRLIMSLTSINSTEHYWHTKDIKDCNEAYEAKIGEIINGIYRFHDILLKPVYEIPIRRLQQPLLFAQDTQAKPLWISELLAVIEGGKGQKSDIKKLIERDQNASPEQIIDHGWELVNTALNAFSHLVGPSPKSLALVPVLYFYTDVGRYVRSLLYGFLYWLLTGSDKDVLSRKRVFAIHRAAFEQILLDNKEDVTGITRKTGSGPDVTRQTARYYQGLLELLVTHKDNIRSESFANDYSVLTQELTNKHSKERIIVGKSRTFTPNQKSALVLDHFFHNPNRCGICGGILDPTADLQHDHIIEHAKGGKTLSPNQRLVHPFCNNQANREIIEAGKKGEENIKLPRFADPDLVTELQQLQFAFSDDPDFY